MKAIYEKPKANIMLNGENVSFPTNIRTKAKMHSLDNSI